MKKACGLTREVVVVNYGGRASDLWWERVAPTLPGLKNPSVIALPGAAVEAAGVIALAGDAVELHDQG